MRLHRWFRVGRCHSQQGSGSIHVRILRNDWLPSIDLHVRNPQAQISTEARLRLYTYYLIPHQTKPKLNKNPEISYPTSTSAHKSVIMNAAQSAIGNLDLDKLNESDKAELRQFLGNQQQRAQIQTRSWPP